MILLKELTTYSKLELKTIISTTIDNSKYEQILKVLEARKVIKYNNKNEIQFSYVGIIIVESIPLFVLPKYMSDKDEEINKKLFKNIITMLNNFSEKEKFDKNFIENASLDEEDLKENLLSIITFILDDYYEYGLYKSEINSTELNGDGDINWENTINQIDAHVINNQWFYADLITNRSIIDTERYVTMLHAKVINECLDYLNNTELIDYLGYTTESIDTTIDDLADIEKIENQIDKELLIQFNDRKRNVLYAIKLYLQQKVGASDNGLLLFGTRNFKWVWEVICGQVFDNEFLRCGNKSKYEVYGIESPKWIIDNLNDVSIENTNEIEMQKNRLTPDILKIYVGENEKYLLILDAKYYNVYLDKKQLKGNPGIDDITKQYLYHTALSKYIEQNKVTKVINAFLFPTEGETYIQGKVSLDFMSKFSNIDINLIQVNVDNIIELYCNNKKYELNKFVSMINKWNNRD